MGTVLELLNVSKRFGDNPVVRDLSLSLSSGRIGCLLGPSGCGKTTILRAVAGFEPIDAGKILIGGQPVSTENTLVPPEQRKIGMVFQDYALFPHLNVTDNVAFGLVGRDKPKMLPRVRELLDLVGLEKVDSKYPHELSGGQQQRVALARALAPRPEVLLLDEPFSNLDATLRERLSAEVRDILKNYGITALLVTHNQHEAFAMADDIGVVHAGRLLQWDTGYNLYHRPAGIFVADFVGEGVLLPGRVLDERRVETALGVLEGEFTYPCRNGCPADVLIRPEDIVHDDASLFRAKILKKTFRGPNILYTLRLPNADAVQALVPSYCQHEVGQYIGIRPQVDDIILFEKHQAEAGAALL